MGYNSHVGASSLDQVGKESAGIMGYLLGAPAGIPAQKWGGYISLYI